MFTAARPIQNRSRTGLRASVQTSVILAALFMIASPRAESPLIREWVERGNAAYETGDYADALDAFQEALAAAPESPHVLYNKGAALYRTGDWTAAIEALEKAAALTADPVLLSRAQFNLGNSFFRQAEAREPNDPETGLSFYEKSARPYQAALAADPQFLEAGQNLEIARLRIQALRDRLKREKEQEARSQSAGDPEESRADQQGDSTEPSDNGDGEPPHPDPSPQARGGADSDGPAERQDDADSNERAHGSADPSQADQQQSSASQADCIAEAAAPLGEAGHPGTEGAQGGAPNGRSDRDPAWSPIRDHAQAILNDERTRRADRFRSRATRRDTYVDKDW